MSDFSYHADQVEKAINEAVAAIPPKVESKISVEITGDTADMLMALGSETGWDVTTVLSHLFEQTRQLAERGLAIPDFIDAIDKDSFRALIPEKDVRAGVWANLKPGDLVFDTYNDIVGVITLYSEGYTPMVDVAEDWHFEVDGDVWADDEDIESWGQHMVTPLTAEEAIRWSNLTANGEDYDTVLAEIRAAHGIKNGDADV